MAVGIVTIWTTEEEGDTMIPLVVGAGPGDDELLGWAPGLVVERKTG